MSYLWPYLEPYSGSSYSGSSDERSKDKDNLDDQEQEGLVLSTRMKTRRIIQGGQRDLINFKCDIEQSKDKLFFIKYIIARTKKTK